MIDIQKLPHETEAQYQARLRKAHEHDISLLDQDDEDNITASIAGIGLGLSLIDSVPSDFDDNTTSTPDFSGDGGSFGGGGSDSSY